MTPDREIEIRLLNLLRNRDYMERYSEKLQPVSGYLSREGQIVLKALDFAMRKGTAAHVGLRDLWALSKDQFQLDEDESKSVKSLLSSMKAFKDKDPTLSTSIVEQYLTRAALMNLSVRAAQMVESNTLDTALIEDLVRIAEPATREDEETLWSYDPSAITEAIVSPKRIPTPWVQVNKEIEGGYSPGELIEVCALSKVGKTHFLVNEVAHTIRRGGCAGYVTITDLNRDAIALLLSRVLLGKTAKQLKKKPAYLKKLRSTLQKHGSVLEVADFTHRGMHVKELDGVVAQWSKRHGKNLKKIVIDRLEEAIPARAADATRIDIASMWKYARSLAQKYKVPVLIDSQAGAHVEGKKRIKITDGAESKVGKAKILDLFFGLAAPHDYDNTQLYLNIQGRRDLSGDLIKMRINKKTGRIKEEIW